MSMQSINREARMEELALALARNRAGAKLPVEDVLKAEGYSRDEFLRFADDTVFQNRVRQLTAEMEKNGVSFQLKARLQAEELIKRQWVIVHDPETPPAVAIKAIENTVRWAGLDAPVQQNSQSGPGFSITINMGDMRHELKAPKAITIEQAHAAPQDTRVTALPGEEYDEEYNSGGRE